MLKTKLKLNLTPLQMSIRRHAADWIKVMGEKLNDSGKEIMFALRDRLGTFSNSPLAGATRHVPLVQPTRAGGIARVGGYLKTSLSKIG